MPKRSDWLTDAARPIAEELAARCGSLKKVMSAGIMALNDLMPEEREYYMAKADGKNLNRPDNTEAEFRRRVLEVVNDALKLGEEKKPARRARKPKVG